MGLRGLANGDQQTLPPMTPQAKQSLSHPISHPLHRMPTASRGSYARGCDSTFVASIGMHAAKANGL